MNAAPDAGLAAEFVLLGYFPKHIATREEFIAKGWALNEIVDEVCSVSGCLSDGPQDWINKWRHNFYFLYDSEEAAAEMTLGEQRCFDILAYRVLRRRFDENDETPIDLSAPTVTSMPESYRRIGFDVIESLQKLECGASIGCSPLSCNGKAGETPVNRYCLIDDFETALETARRFASGRDRVEPGPYYLFEVYRRPRDA